MEEDCHPGVSEVGANSVTTVEIRVRTLDSSNYTVRVDKHLPVPALKDQLAPVVGVPPQNQRLICRGRVLKDDQLLSSYNVEDGHTLHLVPRPEPSPDDPSSGRTESAGTSSRSRHAQITHSLLLGTINIPDATEGGMPDLNRILSAVLNSVGSAGATPAEGRRGVAVMQVHSGSAVPAAASTAPAEGNASRSQTGASSTASDGFQLRSLEVPSDALTTLSHYLSRLEQVFSENGYANSGSIGAHFLSFLSRGSRSGAAASPPPNLPSRPLPTPAALGATINRAQQLLHGQVSAAFSDLAGQLSNEASLDDTLSRADLQANAVWSGNVMQQLGALLLELGRTTMTLRLGPTPAQAVVNSGPAIFVSPSGPNPMMVQPTPFGGFSFASPQSDIGAVSRNSGLNLSAAEIGRRSSQHVSAFQPSFQTSPDSVPEGDAGNQTAEAGPGEQDSEPRLGFLLQDNGSVRIVPVRGRTASAPATGLSIHSRIQTGIRSLRTGPESAIAVPVLGIRAQVHTDQQWTQAVMQASEGQRPVGIALTIPVDVAAPAGVTIPVNVSQAATTAAAAAGSSQQDLDSIFAAYGVRSEAAREPTPPSRPESREQADVPVQSSQVEGAQNMDTEGERKRGGDEIAANAGEASCKPSDEDSQSSEAKRRRV